MNNEILDVLSNFAQIENTLAYEEGTEVSTMSADKTVFASYRTDCPIWPRPFAIYDLNKLINCIKAMTDKKSGELPEIEFHDKYLNIVNSRSKIQFYYADKSILRIPPSREKFNGNASLREERFLKFTLHRDFLQEVFKIKSAINCDNIIISGNADSKDITVELADLQNSSQDFYTTSIDAENVLERTCVKFRGVYDIKKWNFLDLDSYEVFQSSKLISRLAGTLENGNVEYWIGQEFQSTY